MARGQAQDLESLRNQPRVTACVALRAVASLMRLAVNLDCKSPFETGEIENDLAKRMLAAELVATRTLAQLAPDQNFGQIAGAALALGNAESIRTGGEEPSTTLRAVPLPVPGRFWKAILHIRNTPNRGASLMPFSRQTPKASPSTSRVCTGSITPSSHSRAVA